jgi:acyl-[acyl-carrier-protein] desaturase
MLPLLKRPGPDDGWQPSDYLPDTRLGSWRDEVVCLREAARRLSDDLLVAVVGNTVTEEALPSYQTWVNRMRGLGDTTGTDDSPWATWVRGWSAEENRHGDLLNRYLYLCGRVDVRSVEVTIQNLIRNGFSVGTGDDPYKGLIYTAYQERATKISHGAAAQRASEEGDETLARICGVVASDEARHERAYVMAVAEILEADPSGGMVALKETVRSMMSMPGRLMDDGRTSMLYDAYAQSARRAGVYSESDFAAVLRYLVNSWRIAAIGGLSAEARSAQEFVCRVADRYERRAKADAKDPNPSVCRPWIREASCETLKGR